MDLENRQPFVSLPGVGGGHSSQFGVTWDETLVKPDADVGIPAKGQPSHLGSLALDTGYLAEGLLCHTPVGAHSQHSHTGPRQVWPNAACPALDVEFKGCGVSKDLIDLGCGFSRTGE